jgi:tetratricopeptide (TPR) repeat protein
VVLVQIDAEKGEGLNLAKQYNVKGYPTFVLANKEGESISRWWGYSKEMLFDELDLGFADMTTISEKEARYKGTPDAKTARSLASYYNTQGEMKKAASFYEDAAKFDPDNDYANELFEIYMSGYRKKVYTIEEVKTVAEKAVNSEQIDDQAKTGIYGQMSYAMIVDPKDEKMLTFLENGYEHLGKHQETAKKWAKDVITISYALYIEKDEKKAVTLKKASLPEGWIDNPSDLNAFAWWCFENKINLHEADQLGRRGIKLAKPGKEKAMILDTVAEIVNLIGYPEDSFSLMQQAVKEDPDNEYYKKQLVRFRKLDKG